MPLVVVVTQVIMEGFEMMHISKNKVNRVVYGGIGEKRCSSAHS
jgi:hypothetical protein